MDLNNLLVDPEFFTVSEEAMLGFLSRGLWVAAMCTAPVLAIGGGVGLIMALLQAATQVNETAITFVPKVAAVALVLVVLGPWLTDQLVRYYAELFESIATVRTP